MDMYMDWALYPDIPITNILSEKFKMQLEIMILRLGQVWARILKLAGLNLTSIC